MILFTAMTKDNAHAHAMVMGFRKNRVQTVIDQFCNRASSSSFCRCLHILCTIFICSTVYYIKLQLLCIVDMNGCTVWYRLDVAVHNYSYLIIQINNYNELPTFLLNTGIHVYLSQRRASRIARCTSTDVAFLSYA